MATYPARSDTPWDVTLKAYIDDPTGPLGAALLGVLNNLFVKETAVLSPWYRTLRETPAIAKIALVGDSTYDIAAAGSAFHAQLKLFIAPGRELEGMVDANVLNFGVNGGNTAAITNSTRMANLTAAAPDLIIAGPGINDIRTRVLTTRTADVAFLRAILVTGFNAIRAAAPGVPIIASIPNSFITTDVGSQGFVTNDPQESSAIMREAYLSLIDEWPDVIVDDTQEHVFGKTSLVTSPFMSDQIHPSGTGFAAKVAHLITLLGYRMAIASGRIAAAAVASPFAPWTAYGRTVEDPERYVTIAEATYQNQGSTFLDFAFPAGRRLNIQRGDIIELPGGLVSFQIPVTGGGFSNTANGASTRLGFTAGVIPTNTATKGLVRVYRQKFGGDTVVEDIIRDTSWRFKKYGRLTNPTAAGANTFIDITATSVTTSVETMPASEWALATGDRVYIEGVGLAFTIGTDATAGVNGVNQRLTGLASADRSALVGRLVVVVGTHA